MDLLSQIIGVLKPQAVAWRVIETGEPCTIRFPASDLIAFGQVLEGAGEATIPGGRRLSVAAGDFLLLAATSPWSLRTPGDGPTVEFKTIISQPQSFRSRLGGLPPAGAPAVMRLMAGAFGFAAPNAVLLTGLMVPVIHVRAADVAAGRLGALLRLLGDEATSDRPGRALVLDRLLEIILVECFRRSRGGLAEAGTGILAGLGDARIGSALRLMHEDPRRRWTVASLARHVAMSRSAFAARFAGTVGVAPIDYLLNWRMHLAREALTGAPRPMAEIAALAGYGSVSAFSTAFRRATGRSPSRYAPAAGGRPAAPRDDGLAVRDADSNLAATPYGRGSLAAAGEPA